jgi:UDP-glucuronate decarboxylase
VRLTIVDRRNIEDPLSYGRFEGFRHNATFPLFVEVDQIDTPACLASSIHYQRDPAQATTTRLLGAINMLGLAKRLPCRAISARRGQLADRKVLWRGFGRGDLAGSVQGQEDLAT